MKATFLLFVIWHFVNFGACHQKIRCPRGIEKFGAKNEPHKYWYCEKRGELATLRECKGNGVYNQQTERCQGAEDEADGHRRKKRNTGEQDLDKKGKGKTGLPKESKREPTLGRPVVLGALFYQKTGRIANDESLWRKTTLEEKKVIDKVESSSSKVKTTQYIVDRWDAFELSASVSANFPLFSVSGSASYLNDKRTKDKSVSVSFLYESLTSTEHISQDMRTGLDYPEVCKYLKKKNPPTHIVSAITYGFRGIQNVDAHGAKYIIWLSIIYGIRCLWI